MMQTTEGNSLGFYINFYLLKFRTKFFNDIQSNFFLSVKSDYFMKMNLLEENF